MAKKRFEELLKRTLYSSITIIIVGSLLYFAEHPICKGLLFLFVALLASFAAWEFGQIAKAKQASLVKGVLEIGAFSVVFSFFLSTIYETFSLLPMVVLLGFMILFFTLHFQKQSSAILSVSVQTFALFYIAVPLALFLPLVYSMPSMDGRWWVIYLLTVTKIFDMTAYFGGKLFGKRKLAPKVSPNKTIEGAFLGLIFSILASLFFSYLGNAGLIDFALDYQKSFVLGAILGILGQVGDLSESLFKRDAKIKDSNSLPGMGGVLDMVDSLLFTTPVLYFVLIKGLIK